jgi:hypothetical protein
VSRRRFRQHPIESKLVEPRHLLPALRTTHPCPDADVSAQTFNYWVAMIPEPTRLFTDADASVETLRAIPLRQRLLEAGLLPVWRQYIQNRSIWRHCHIQCSPKHFESISTQLKAAKNLAGRIAQQESQRSRWTMVRMGSILVHLGFPSTETIVGIAKGCARARGISCGFPDMCWTRAAFCSGISQPGIALYGSHPEPRAGPAAEVV